ncbi:MAG: hypothetical protein LBQ15_06435 [Clostridium sp.]|nr:hypothetical protein [Clostridium sp.]
MKKHTPFESPKLWKDSLTIAFMIIGGIETVMSVLSVTLECAGKVPARIGLVIGAYAVITVAILFLKYRRSQNEIVLNIRGIKVTIKEGDIFEADG